MRRAVRWQTAALALAGTLAATGPNLEAAEQSQSAHGPDAVIATLGGIEQSLRSSRYSHTTRVEPGSGLYEFDCSGLVAWVLRRAAPRAHAAVAWRAKSNHPLARDYYTQIAATRRGVPARWGWSRVARVEDAAPGDVIAWLKPKEIRSANTGHVAFLVAPPKRIPGELPAYLVRVADASRYQHQDDSRTDSGRDGYGTGTILVIADPETGAPIAYGWVGLHSAWVLSAKMAIGRPEH